jgi:hypothetical protein
MKNGVARQEVEETKVEPEPETEIITTKEVTKSEMKQ